MTHGFFFPFFPFTYIFTTHLIDLTSPRAININIIPQVYSPVENTTVIFNEVQRNTSCTRSKIHFSSVVLPYSRSIYSIRNSFINPPLERCSTDPCFMMIPDAQVYLACTKKRERERGKKNKQISERKGINRASERATNTPVKGKLIPWKTWWSGSPPPPDLNRRRRIADKIQPISSLIRSSQPRERERETRKTVHNLALEKKEEKREKEKRFVLRAVVRKRDKRIVENKKKGGGETEGGIKTIVEGTRIARGPRLWHS